MVFKMINFKKYLIVVIHNNCKTVYSIYDYSFIYVLYVRVIVLIFMKIYLLFCIILLLCMTI